MELKEINDIISKTICWDSVAKLEDSYLLNEYMQCESVKKEINKLKFILNKYVNDETQNNIINEYVKELIPPGTKGVIRGNKFNSIVKNFIESLNLKNMEIRFESQPPGLIRMNVPIGIYVPGTNY